MGKSRDGKVPILPSTTRRGTVLNTSAALDSPCVMSKFLTPPHTYATQTATTAESKTSDAYDAASTVLDKSGSLGPFLDATIARTIAGNTETPNEDTTTPVSSPEASESYALKMVMLR